MTRASQTSMSSTKSTYKVCLWSRRANIPRYSNQWACTAGRKQQRPKGVKKKKKEASIEEPQYDNTDQYSRSIISQAGLKCTRTPRWQTSESSYLCVLWLPCALKVRPVLSQSAKPESSLVSRKRSQPLFIHKANRFHYWSSLYPASVSSSNAEERSYLLKYASLNSFEGNLQESKQLMHYTSRLGIKQSCYLQSRNV